METDLTEKLKSILVSLLELLDELRGKGEQIDLLVSVVSHLLIVRARLLLETEIKNDDAGRNEIYKRFHSSLIELQRFLRDSSPTLDRGKKIYTNFQNLMRLDESLHEHLSSRVTSNS